MDKTTMDWHADRQSCSFLPRRYLPRLALLSLVWEIASQFSGFPQIKA